MNPLSIAARDAPRTAGVYFFLGADTELLYVGKAKSLATRLLQHARAKPGAGGDRLDVLYQRIGEVRWCVMPTEDAAADWEADVIVALRPVFNAAHADQGRWNYVVVEPSGGRGDDVSRFTLSPVAPAKSRAYGCFPHLGRGVSSRPAIACSDGYTAMLRLLWAASATRRPRVPSRVTRAAPDRFEVRVPASVHVMLHAFLSGTSRRMLDEVVETPPGEPYLAPALARDRDAAEAFFVHGPRAVRACRLRHGQPAGALSRETIEHLVASDVREAIGEFRLPTPRDATDAALGRRAHPWARSRPARTLQ